MQIRAAVPKLCIATPWGGGENWGKASVTNEHGMSLHGLRQCVMAGSPGPLND
jgi:hypothetical protein